MKVGHNWQASFIDGKRRVMLTKPGCRTARSICIQYDYPFIRRIDAKTGMRATDTFNVLPPDVHQAILAARKERWGEA